MSNVPEVRFLPPVYANDDGIDNDLHAMRMTNKGFMVTPDDGGYRADWASKPDANVVADDVEHWLHDITMMDSKVTVIARDIVLSSRKKL